MGFKPFLSPDWLPALYVLQALSCWAMRSSKSWRDREQELLALEVAGARIHSSVEKNLEGNLILVGLELVSIYSHCYCRRNPQRPKRSRVNRHPAKGSRPLLHGFHTAQGVTQDVAESLSGSQLLS